MELLLCFQWRWKILAISLDVITDFAIAEGCLLFLFKVHITFFMQANNTVVTVVLRTSFFLYLFILGGREVGGGCCFVCFFPPYLFIFFLYCSPLGSPCSLAGNHTRNSSIQTIPYSELSLFTRYQQA